MQAGGGDPAHDTELEQKDPEVSSPKAAVFHAFVVQLSAAKFKYAFLLRITVIIKTTLTITRTVATFYTPLLQECDTVTSKGSQRAFALVNQQWEETPEFRLKLLESCLGTY